MDWLLTTTTVNALPTKSSAMTRCSFAKCLLRFQSMSKNGDPRRSTPSNAEPGHFPEHLEPRHPGAEHRIGVIRPPLSGKPHVHSLSASIWMSDDQVPSPRLSPLDSPGGMSSAETPWRSENRSNKNPLLSAPPRLCGRFFSGSHFPQLGGMRLFPKSGRAGRSFGHSMDAAVGRGKGRDSAVISGYRGNCTGLKGLNAGTDFAELNSSKETCCKASAWDLEIPNS